MMDLKTASGKIFFVSFIVLNLLLSSFFTDVQQRWNSTSRMLTVLAATHYHTLQIDRFHERTGDKSFVNGHYYSEKAPLPALATIPFYLAVKSSGDMENDENGLIGKRAYMMGNIICGSLPFVFILSLLFLKIQGEKPAISPVLLSTLPFYGSFVFLYSGAFMNHLFSAALLIVSFLFLKDKKNFFLSGIFAGLAFLSDFSLAIAAPIWALQIFFNQKSFKAGAVFIMGFLPSLAFLSGYNYLLTGNPFKMLYQFVSHEDFSAAKNTLGFTSIHFSALWKMLFSEYRGIFLYFPALILIFISFLRHFRFSKELFTGNYLFPLAVIHFLLISAHEIWWGGACAGPRHLIPIALLIAFEGIRCLVKRGFSPGLFAVFTLPGLTIAWMAKSTEGYRIPDELERPVTEGIIPWFLEENFNRDNILTMIFGTDPETAIYSWLVMFILFITLLHFWFRKLSKTKIYPAK